MKKQINPICKLSLITCLRVCVNSSESSNYESRCAEKEVTAAATILEELDKCS